MTGRHRGWVLGLLWAAGCASAGAAPGADATAADAATAPSRDDAAPAPADAAAGVDAPPAPPDASPGPDGPPAAYQHTITIDGANDFAAGAEAFATTSQGYTAYVSWDAGALYVGYEGEDIDSSSPQRWVLVYLDVDPGAGAGASVGERYNTQQPGFPTGFRADYYFRWKASNDFQDLRRFDGDTWESVEGVAPETYQSGTFLETRLSLSDLGDPDHLAVVTLMLNEADLAEGAYAGLYADSFTDGYYDADVAPIPIQAFLDADLTSTLDPNDPSRRAP